MPATILGKNVQRFREERKWTQEELAKRAGTKGPNISKIELGKSRPKDDLLQRIAGALDKTMRQLDPRHERYDPHAPRRGDGDGTGVAGLATDLEEEVAIMFKTSKDFRKLCLAWMDMPPTDQRRVANFARKLGLRGESESGEESAEGVLLVRKRERP